MRLGSRPVRHLGLTVALTLPTVSLAIALLNCRVPHSHSSTSEDLKLQEEFNSISSPSWATKVEDTNLIKQSSGLIGALYSTARSFSDIRKLL